MTDKLNKEKNKHHAKDDSKKEIRLTRLKRLEKKLKSNILKRKKARMGRNPKTKAEALISERNVIVFRPSMQLKNKINLS